MIDGPYITCLLVLSFVENSTTMSGPLDGTHAVSCHTNTFLSVVLFD